MKNEKTKTRRDEYEYKKLGDKCSDDSGDDVELYPKKLYQEPPTVEKVVEEGDTLQSLAIRYGCSVAELKRLNHILNDNEIYAKGVVKVPDRPFSTILAGVHSSGRSSPTGRTALKKIDHLDSLESKLKTSLLLNIPSTSKSKNFNEVIFNSTIASKPCEVINETQQETSYDDEEITLLPKSVQKSSPEVVSKFTCSGADADISWIALIICIIIVIVAVPLISSFYIYEHPEQYNHHVVHNNSHSS
ncbi:hypothetical protein MML48_2g00011417 [Holotrichia oblita]|uniref:Uncharacterized protein n=1 Tax=Holotrichia oblita TaxID=644536 RepID=A0ACB9TKS4_HOLOL|nr:hypothetical protein MML48_2g00011417 [Holotrichia oblita]